MKSRSKPTCFVPAYSPPKLGGEPEAAPYFLRLRAIALALRAGSRFAVREATPPNLGGEYAIADKLAYNTAPFLRIAYKGDSPYAPPNMASFILFRKVSGKNTASNVVIARLE